MYLSHILYSNIFIPYLRAEPFETANVGGSGESARMQYAYLTISNSTWDDWHIVKGVQHLLRLVVQKPKTLNKSF